MLTITGFKSVVIIIKECMYSEGLNLNKGIVV
jgi:hypothetical protein